MKTRESVGRPIHLLVPPVFQVPFGRSSPDTLDRYPRKLPAAASQRPKLEDVEQQQQQQQPERKEKKRWQARALDLVGRLRGKNRN
jgi:hypothetical protein